RTSGSRSSSPRSRSRDLAQDLEQLLLTIGRERVDGRMVGETGDELPAESNAFPGQAHDLDAAVVGSGTRDHETALDKLVDDAREVRRIHAAPLRRFLQRGSVAGLEPPEQLRLRIRQLDGLEARALVVKLPRGQVRPALDGFLSQAGLRGHNRYLTAFLDQVPIATCQ